LNKMTYHNHDINKTKLFFLSVALLAACLWVIDDTTGILTEEHLENEQMMAQRHGPGHPLYNQMVEELIADTMAPEDWKRKIAAKELGQLGSGASRAMPYLKELLRDETPAVRNEAAIALAKMKPLNFNQSANI